MPVVEFKKDHGDNVKGDRVNVSDAAAAALVEEKVGKIVGGETSGDDPIG